MHISWKWITFTSYFSVDPSVPDNLSYSAANLSITSEIVHAQNCSTNDEILIEGGSIIVLCDGNVGRPAGNLIVQKIQNNSELYNFTAIDNKSSSPDNCSVYLNSTFTVNLTAEDNGGHLRCAEERYVLNNEMSKKSDPLDVKCKYYFEVRYVIYLITYQFINIFCHLGFITSNC